MRFFAPKLANRHTGVHACGLGDTEYRQRGHVSLELSTWHIGFWLVAWGTQVAGNVREQRLLKSTH